MSIMGVEIWKSLPKMEGVDCDAIDMTGIDFVMPQPAYESLLSSIESTTNVGKVEVLPQLNHAQIIGNVLVFPTQPDSTIMGYIDDGESEELDKPTIQETNIGYASIMGWGIIVGSIVDDPVLRGVGIAATVFGEVKLMQNGVIPTYGALVDGLRSDVRWFMDILDAE